MGARSRRSKSPFSGKPRNLSREAASLGDARHLVGRDLANDAPRRRIPIWLIPGIVVGGVFAALAIAHVRVELIGQGYKRYSAVERLQALEEEKRILTAHVRELRDPARLAELAREDGTLPPRSRNRTRSAGRRAAPMRSARVQISLRRIGIARILLLIPFAVLGIRAAHLSVDERGIARGENQTRRVLELAPGRGAIVDSSGAELALSVESPSIYAIPSSIDDVDVAAAKLAPILGWKRQKLADRMRDRQSFFFLARWVTPERAQQVLDLGLAGVGVLDEPRRIYPHRHLGAQLVGFANIDGEGVRGIEQQEDDWLRGLARRIPVERDARGRKLWIGGDSQWSTTGGDVALTIDATLQAQAEEALRETVAASGARGGIVVAMDPWTGDILALAENPGFDPNHFRSLDFASTRSRAFADAIDPGSTLKTFLIAAALEEGAIQAR